MEDDTSLYLLDTTDGIAFLVFLGITSADQHDTDCRTLIELDGALVEITLGNTLEEIHDIALQTEHDTLCLRVAHTTVILNDHRISLHVDKSEEDKAFVVDTLSLQSLYGRTDDTVLYFLHPLFGSKWDWGYSKNVQPNVAASTIIMSRIGYSIRLNILSVVFSVPIGILLGIWAALKKNTMTDHTISTLVMVFISIPSFVLISFVLRIFCYNLGWLPSTWPPDTAPTAAKIRGYIIPVFCLSFGSICGYCRYTRAELCEVMESDYLLLARTKGLTRRQAIVRHALKNAMVPIFPSILAEFIGILGGSMILESLYGIPGIGKLFILSLNYKDYDILFVEMAIFTTISLLAGVVLDLSYGFIDPRIRMGAKK